MPVPQPIWLYHFTHVDHLASIARDGLVCDAQAHARGRLVREVGNIGIKADRRARAVPEGPGGCVGDYVPFYFAPRSPMLYAIHKGNVPTYQGGQDGLVYLCTTLGEVERHGLKWVATDRNAALNITSFTTDAGALETHVDWALMNERLWANTQDDPDRRARRQAELLVHGALPWEAVLYIAARTDEDLSRVEEAVGTLGGHQPRRCVRGGWYF